MLKVQEIRELIKLVDQSSINEFVYEHEGYKIKMKKNTVVNKRNKLVSAPVAPVAASPSGCSSTAVETAVVSQP